MVTCNLCALLAYRDRGGRLTAIADDTVATVDAPSLRCLAPGHGDALGSLSADDVRCDRICPYFSPRLRAHRAFKAERALDAAEQALAVLPHGTLLEEVTVDSRCSSTDLHATFGGGIARAMALVRTGTTVWDSAAAKCRTDTEILSALARGQPEGVPLYTARHGEPLVVLPLSPFYLDEHTLWAASHHMARLDVGLTLMPSYPVLRQAVMLPDDMEKPFTAVGYSRIESADVQAFILALLAETKGRLQIYVGGELQQEGDIRLPGAFDDHLAHLRNLVRYGQAARRAAEHLAHIPAGQRDHEAAIAGLDRD